MESNETPGRPSWTQAERLAALRAYDVVDTPPEKEFDDLVQIASEVCRTPIALLTFLEADRQVFKAEVGTDLRETPLKTSFCAHALSEDEMLVVPDTLQDPRFHDFPFVAGVPYIRFYTGILLKTPQDVPIGTICVLDTVPRMLDDHQIRMLRLLARQAMTQLELRRSLIERDRALRAVHAIEARHRQIVDSALEFAIITMDLDGVVTSWNVGAERIIGWSQEEMCGRSAAIFFTPEDSAAGVPKREFERARETGRGADERWHRRKDGSRFWASGEMMQLRDDDDGHVGYLKILRDRTAEHKAGQALQRSEVELREADDAKTEILESISDAFYAVDREWRFTYVNRRAEELWSRTDADLRGKVYWDEFPEAVGSSSYDAHQLAMAERRPVRIETVSPLIHRWVEVDVHPTASGGLSVYFRDISERKQAEQQRLELTRELAHRMKNTLAMVQAIVTQTFRTATTIEDGREGISSRIAALARAQDILTRTSWAQADIQDVVEGALAPHQTDDARIVCEGPNVELTAQQGLGLSLALHELATNAAKYGALSSPEGRIDVHWSTGADGSFTFEWIESGGPAVQQPERTGFGTRLIERIVAPYFSGSGKVTFNPGGVAFRLDGTLA